MKIYLLNSARLAEDLAEKRVTPRQQALYLLLGWVFYSTVSYSTLVYSNSSWTWIGFAEFICVVAISVFGVFYAYKQNGGDKGEEFVVRFTCLLLPVSINVYVIARGCYYLLAWWFRKAIYGFSFSSQQKADQFVRFTQQDLPWMAIFIFVVLTQSLIFWRISRHMGRISARKHSGSCLPHQLAP